MLMKGSCTARIDYPACDKRKGNLGLNQACYCVPFYLKHSPANNVHLRKD